MCVRSYHTSLGGGRVRAAFLQRLRSERTGHQLRARGHQHWRRVDFQRHRSGNFTFARDHPPSPFLPMRWW